MSDAFLGIRQDYAGGQLDRDDLPEDPFVLLRAWLDEAHGKTVEPTAMCLSSVGPEGRPSSRFLLLRGVDYGLVFYTNYLSRKGTELDGFPFACANFWWGELERQIRVEGRVERVSAAESDAYFAGRPYESRLASAASPQSQVVSGRAELEDQMEALRAAHPEHLERPAHWGGYRLIPDRFEFWQGRKARLHDRFIYVLDSGVWTIQRLAP